MATPTIKINHYLNKNLKPIINNKGNQYPIYIRILHGRNVMRIKSVLIPKYFKVFNYFNDFDFENNNILKNIIEKEQRIIKYILESGNTIFINNISDTISFFSMPILEVLYITLYSSDKLYIDEYVRNNFIEYVSNKANVNKNIFINTNLFNTTDLKQYEYLDNLEFINDDKIKEIINLIKLFIVFEKENANNKISTDICYWVMEQGKEKFYKYTLSNNFNTKMIDEVLNEIDDTINEAKELI